MSKDHLINRAAYLSMPVSLFYFSRGHPYDLMSCTVEKFLSFFLKIEHNLSTLLNYDETIMLL